MIVLLVIIIIVIIKIIIIIIVIMIWIPTAITVNHCDLDHCPKLDEGGEGHNRQWGQEANPTQTSCALHLFACTVHTCTPYRTQEIFYLLERAL